MRLRNLSFALLLFILGPCTAYPALLFDTNTDRATVADGPALTLPDADWTISLWVKMNTAGLTGSSTRKVITWNYSQVGNGYFELAIHPASSTDPFDITFDVIDNDGTNVFMTSTSNPFQSNTSWTNIIIERDGTTISVWINAVQVASATNAAIDAVDVAFPLYIGNRDTNDRLFDGSIAGLGKWDAKLTTPQKNALAAGYAPNCFPNSLVLYPPLIREKVELKAGLAVTESGTVVVEHPRMIYCGE